MPIGDDQMVNERLQSFKHGFKVTSLAVFYRVHVGTSGEELGKLKPAPSIHQLLAASTF